MSERILTSEAVSKLFAECLFKEEEDKTNFIAAEGITVKVGFHPGRIQENKEKIKELLMELPEEFMEDGESGGMSFLAACEDKNGHQWTGLHSIMQELFLLGIASGQAKELLPRDLWVSLPGGVPYYSVKAK